MVEGLCVLHTSLGLQDVWRSDNPSECMYTFFSNANSMSRLDRIYTRPSLTKYLYNWDCVHTSIPSDHKMVLVRYALHCLPHIRKGRWTWPLGLIPNEALTHKIANLGMGLQHSLEHQHPHPGTDTQQLWSTFKNQITSLAQKTACTQLSKMLNKTNVLQKDITQLNQHPQIDENPNIQ